MSAHELRVELDGKMNTKDRELLLAWIGSRLATDAPGTRALFDPARRTPTLVLQAPDAPTLERAAHALEALVGDSNAAP